MKCIIGLGNPEPRYDATRHNVGFMFCDLLAHEWGAVFKRMDKFHADIAEASIAGEKILIIKPITYYNEVGNAARSIADFYKISSDDILIIHDDLALPLGTIRTRIGGSDGGNNGLKSLAAHIGTHTARIRIGTWTDTHHGADKVTVVLGKFTRPEQDTLTQLEPIVMTLINDFIAGAFIPSTHRLDLDTEQRDNARHETQS